MQTTRKCQAQFTLPELHDNRLIVWDVHVTKNLGAYDMIIGQDILIDLGIDIKFSTQEVEWDGNSIPLRNSELDFKEAYYVNDSDIVEDAATRIKGILDAKYEPADLHKVCSSADHLTSKEQAKLEALLSKYKTLFDGSLGHWNDTEYEIELRPDAKPYHARSYPIPKVHLETLKAEVQ